METYTTRYKRLREQDAYERRVRAAGVSALLAPYTSRVPAQRKPTD